MSTPTDQLQMIRAGRRSTRPNGRAKRRQTRPTDGAPGLVPDDRPAADGKGSRLPAVDAYPFPFDGDAPIQRLRARRSLDPDFCPPPPVQLQTRSTACGGRPARRRRRGRGDHRPVRGRRVSLAERLAGVGRQGDRACVGGVAAGAGAGSRTERIVPRSSRPAAARCAGEPAPIGVSLEGAPMAPPP